MKNLAKLLVLTLLLSGCATKEYVHEYVQGQLKPVNTRVDALEGRANSTDAALTSGSSGLEATSKRLDDAIVTLKVHSDRLARTRPISPRSPRPPRMPWSAPPPPASWLPARWPTKSCCRGQGQVRYQQDGPEQTGRWRRSTSSPPRSRRKTGVSTSKFRATPNSIGSAAHNHKVGQQRADAVRSYLHTKGASRCIACPPCLTVRACRWPAT